LTAKTINNALSILRRALTEAMEWGRIEKLPRFKFLKTAPPTFDFLHPSEGEALMRAVTREPWRLMVRCALRTGLRFGELLGLRWEDIDFDRNLIVVRRNVVDGQDGTPKNNRFRMVPLASSLRNELLAFPRRAERVFVLADGRTPNRWSAIEALQHGCERAELRQIGWHVLRHSFASQLVGAGVNLAMIQALLGHSTLEMTMRYAHVAGEHLQRSIDALESDVTARVNLPSTDGERGANMALSSTESQQAALLSSANLGARNAIHSAVGEVF
jgi:integrase